MKSGLLKSLVLTLMMVFCASIAFAEYPERSVRIIIPYNPGGDSDLHARMLVKAMSGKTKEPVVVQNMSGAGGTIATKYVIDADPDGYTAFIHHPTLLISEIVGTVDYGYKDMDLIGRTYTDASDVIIINPKTHPDWKTLKDMMAYAKANPNKLTYASLTGNWSYFQAKLLEKEAGVKFKIVDAGDGAQKLTSTLAGRLDCYIGTYGMVKDYIKSGKLKALAVLSKERHPQLPDVPTAAESGYNIDLVKKFYAFMPKGTPEDVKKVFTEYLETAINSPEFAESEKAIYGTPNFLPADKAAEDIKAYYELLDGLAKDSK